MVNIFQKIRSIEIQGAITIAEESLKYLKKYAKRHGFGLSFSNECDKLLKTRPTAVPLFNVISMVKKSKSVETIDELLFSIRGNRKKIAENGSAVLKKSIVMTHCHSIEVVALLKKNRNKIKSVIVTETRPKNQGLLTVKDLRGVLPVTFIVDSACGYYMKDTDIVIVGSDAIRKEGIVNKIGTYLLAVAANEQGIPFYVAASTLKYDKRKKIEIEMRSPKEIGEIERVKILNPAFDITPWRYITGVITEQGIKKPKEILMELRG